MAKIFVTRQIPSAGIEKLKNKGYEVIVGPEGMISREELLEKVKGVDAILSVLTEKIDKEVLEAAGPNLKIVANYAVGFDNIDISEAKKRKIYVTNTPGVLTHTVAEHTIALMAALMHRVVEGDQFVRDGKYKGWGPTLLLGEDLENKILGVVGFGAIGKRVAEIARFGFGMKIIYYDLAREPEAEKRLEAQFRSLEDLLKEADVISLHVPLNEKTRHLISTKEFGLMKKTAYLINTSRGAVIDENALFNALYTNRLAGAALDVFEYEPAIAGSKFDARELIKLNNIIFTPHTASASLETRTKMAEMAALNIIEALEGRQPPNLVYQL